MGGAGIGWGNLVAEWAVGCLGEGVKWWLGVLVVVEWSG